MAQTNGTIQYFDGNIALDFFHAFTGEKLGDGIAREVFVFKHDTSLVLKVELGMQDFQNVHEWSIWNDAPAWARKWLAPIRYISPYGHVLIQERCDPFSGKPPKKVPAFLADVKGDNWGILKGKPVCFDYGRHNLFNMGLLKKRLVVNTKWK